MQKFKGYFYEEGTSHQNARMTDIQTSMIPSYGHLFYYMSAIGRAEMALIHTIDPVMKFASEGDEFCTVTEMLDDLRIFFKYRGDWIIEQTPGFRAGERWTNNAVLCGSWSKFVSSGIEMVTLVPQAVVLWLRTLQALCTTAQARGGKYLAFYPVD